MGRRQRIHYPGAIYHVIARGNDRQPIFHDEADRSRFEELVADGVSRFEHRIHAYCWMTNHIHLASQVGEISISKIMQNLCGRYAKVFNQRYHRSGHLFDRRFRAFLIRDDNGVRRLLRYIHLNPYRAGLTDTVDDYPWSSQRAYSEGACPPWLETDWMTGLFGSDVSEGRKNLREFVMAGISDLEVDKKLVKKQTSGPTSEEALSSPLLDRPGWQLASVGEIVSSIARNLEFEESVLAGRNLSRPVAQARGIAAWLVRECRGQGLSELARLWHRHPSALSRAAARTDKSRKRDPKLQELIQSTADSLTEEMGLKR